MDNLKNTIITKDGLLTIYVSTILKIPEERLFEHYISINCASKYLNFEDPIIMTTKGVKNSEEMHLEIVKKIENGEYKIIPKSYTLLFDGDYEVF